MQRYGDFELFPLQKVHCLGWFHIMIYHELTLVHPQKDLKIPSKIEPQQLNDPEDNLRVLTVTWEGFCSL